MNKRSKRCAPIIVFLDIVIVLLFVYIILPREEGFNMKLSYGIGLADDIKIIESPKVPPNSPTNSINIWRVKNNKITHIESIVSKFAGYGCENKCLNILKENLHLNISSKNEYAIYLPEKLMSKAYSLWDNFCAAKSTDIECNNQIIIDVSISEVYLCSKTKKKYFYSDSDGKLITLDDQCK